MRKESLEKLTSPEQLDRLLVIIRLPGWIALICLLILIGLLLLWSIFGRIPITAEGLGIFFDPDSIEVLQTDTRGVIEKIYVKEGETVKSEDPLMLVKEPTRDLLIQAPTTGKVLAVEGIVGQGVEFGNNLIWFQRFDHEEGQFIYSFFPVEQGGRIKPGMETHIQFDSVHSELYGKMVGKVKDVLLFGGGSSSDIFLSIPSSALRSYLSQNQASITVIIEPKLDPSTPSGYAWTTGKGPPFQIELGALAKVKIFLEEKKPINYILPTGDK